MSDLKRVSDIDLSPLLDLARSRPERDPWERVPLAADGMPVDQTRCPWCHGDRPDCRHCGGSGMVCPTCRGSRIMRRDVPFRPSYTGCPDCTDWLDHRNHAWDDHNWPVFRRDPAREVAAIRRVLSAMRRAAVPS